jgi:hypothetical protein
MANEWVGGIGVLLGAITTGIFSVVTRRYQLKEEREKLLLERDIAFNKERLDRLSSRKEELFNLLQNLSSGFSITQNYRMEQANISSKEYDMHYEEMNQIALRVELLAHLYFPELIEEVKGICGLTNIIWGQQQRIFGHSEKNNQDQQIIRNNIVQYSSELGGKCLMIMNSLSSNNS